MGRRQSLTVQETSTLEALIRACDDPPNMLTEDELTDRVVDRLRGMGDAAWPLIRTEVRHRTATGRTRASRRGKGRAVERTFTPGDGTVPWANPVRELALRQLREFTEGTPTPDDE